MNSKNEFIKRNIKGSVATWYKCHTCRNSNAWRCRENYCGINTYCYIGICVSYYDKTTMKERFYGEIYEFRKYF